MESAEQGTKRVLGQRAVGHTDGADGQQVVVLLVLLRLLLWLLLRAAAW